MAGFFDAVAPTRAEIDAAHPGDEVLDADVVMDRAFTLRADLAEVWPWLMQLGKQRAGWYLPRRVERLMPRRRRAVRRIEDRWQHLVVGDTIPDWGGADASFTVAEIVPGHHVVYWSQRGRMRITWAIAVHPAGQHARVTLRLRLAPVRRPWLARTFGEWIDLLTVAGLAAGLRERLEAPT